MSTPATCQGDTGPTLPVVITTGVNDEFVYTPAATGTPETFTAAAGTYTTGTDVIAAMAAAVGLSSERFDTIAIPSDSGTPGSLGTATGDSFSLPVIVATGVNDEFVLTPPGGPPQTCTVAPGVYANNGGGQSSLSAAMAAAIGPPPIGFSEFAIDIGAAPSPVAAFLAAVADGWTVSAGTNDFLASIGVTATLTTAGAANCILLTSTVSGTANNGDTITFGSNDLAATLGFVGDPDTFAGGTSSPSAPGFLSSGIIGRAEPPPPPASATEGIDYCVVACDMWGCAYGEIAGVQVTQIDWQLDDLGGAAFTFPMQQAATSTFGVDMSSGSGLGNADILPASCIPGGREVQVWRNQKLEQWCVPINATPSATLVSIQCSGLLWWLDNVLFGPTLTESLIDGDFEVSGALGSLDAYWPSSLGVVASLVDANTGAPGVVTGRWAAQLVNGSADADEYIESRFVVDTVFDGQPVTVTGWVYIKNFIGGAIDDRAILAVLYEDGSPIQSWATQLTADMPLDLETAISLAIGPLVIERPHIIPAPVFALGVRLYCPHGEVVWDDVHVTVQAPPFNGTATEIATALVQYAQDPTQGKSTFAMPVEVIGTPPTDVLQRDYLGQSQNSSVLGAFAEFIAEGYFDYEVTWDPTGHFRTFTMFCPSKGAMQYNYPLTLDAGTVTQLNGTIDGSTVATTQRVLGQGSGGSGSESAYRAFGGFLASGRGAGFPGGRLPRVITDGIIATTVGVTESTLVSFDADFDLNDVGQPVTCLTPGVLPPGCYIGEILSPFEALILSADEGLVTSIGGTGLTVSVGGFTIEQSASAQTNQPPGALAGLAQGNLLRSAAAQAMLSPRLLAGGTNGSNGLLDNVVVGDIIPVATDYGWLTITGKAAGEPVLQRVVALSLYPVTEEIQPTLNVINTALGGAIDVADLPGVPIPYAGVTIPGGYIACDGAGYDPADYPSLFGAIGYLWGGSGSTFHVPDFRTKALVGAGGGHAVGASFGAASVELVAGQMPLQDVDITQSPHEHGPPDGGPAQYIVGSEPDSTIYTNEGADVDHSPAYNLSASSNTEGADADITAATVGNADPDPVPTQPPSAAVQWMLRAF